MGYIILVIFIFTTILCYLEDNIKKYRLPLYLLIGLILILAAGFREVGIDPDSENYEYTYQHYFADNAKNGVEYSYIMLSSFFSMFTSDVHIIFLFYAAVGICLKFFAFRKYGISYFLPVLVYISFYYELHENTQIRTCIVSGLLLLALIEVAEKNKKKAIILLLLGSFFHTSALLLLPLVFLSNKPLSKKKKIICAALIPISYVVYFSGMSLIMNTNIPYIGNKLALYQKGVEKGLLNVSINVFSPLQIFTIFLYYFTLYFHDTITIFNKYTPLLLKTASIGISAFAAFAILPVFAQRVSFLFNIVNIILYSSIMYTIKPKWIGITIVALISIALLNYGFVYIQFPFLWKVG